MFQKWEGLPSHGETDRIDGSPPFVVIGGVAATIQGSARFTNDIGVCYDTASDNIERLVKSLLKWKAYLRSVEPELPFILDARAFRITPVMTLTTDKGAIHVLDVVPGVGDYDACLRASELVSIGNVEFRSLTLTRSSPRSAQCGGRRC